MNRTAIAYRLAGKLDEGFSMCEEALKLATDSLPAEHSELLNAKQNIASIYESKDLIEKAIEYSKQVYDTCQRLDPDNRDAIWSANSLATKYRNAERFDDAIQLLQTAFDKSKKRLGEDHPFTLMVQNNLVDTSEAMGNIKVAVSLGEDLVTRRIEKLGPDHPDTISSMNNLAFAFQSDGQIDKALELFEKTLASSQKKLGEDHPSTMTLVNNLAMTYWRAKQLDKSIPLFESVIEHLEKQMGRDHIYTQTTIANLGVNYRDDKQYDLAAVYLEEAYNASKSDPRLEWVSESLRGLYVKDERDEDFLKLVEDELETARKRYKTSELGLLDIMASIGRDLVSSKHYQQAEKLLRQTLKDSEALGADHWRNCHVNSLLGAIRLRTERIDEAAPMLESGYLGMKAQADDIPGYNRTTFLKGAAQTLVEYAELIEDADALAKWQAEFDSYSPTN